MAGKKGDFKLVPGELVYDHFIKHYLTGWFRSKKVSAYIYTEAMNELELLKKKKKVKFNKKQEDNTSDKMAVQVLGNPPPVKSTPPSASPKQHTNQSRGEISLNTLKQVEFELQSSISENKQLLQNINKLRERLAHAAVEMQEKDTDIERLTRMLEHTRADRDELTLRLSKIAGDKIRDNNPNIADLSDKNRPTELGKRFSEMYDNEWSDAFEKLHAVKDDDGKVRVLFEIVQSTFTYCENKFNGHEQDIRNILLGQSTQEYSEPVRNKTKRTQNIHSILKDVRKEFALETASNIAKDQYLKTMEDKPEKMGRYRVPEYSAKELEKHLQGNHISKSDTDQTLVTYSERCAELCWLMMVCDPPMAISINNEGKPYSLTLYKPYTRSLKDLKKPVVELNVWPALYLHLNGPLVSKGVAQPMEGKK